MVNENCDYRKKKLIAISIICMSYILNDDSAYCRIEIKLQTRSVKTCLEIFEIPSINTAYCILLLPYNKCIKACYHEVVSLLNMSSV